jgi:hypothetical protein
MKIKKLFMKYLKNYDNYQVNEGLADNLKKMASIGLLTTSMLMGNSSVAQQYKKLDSKQKTEIKDEAKVNKVFRIGGIKMGMSIDELKSLGIEIDDTIDTQQQIVDLEKSIDSTVQKLLQMQQVLNSKKSNQKEYLEYFDKVFNKFIHSDEYKIYTSTFYRIKDLKSKLEYQKIPISISMKGIDEKGLEYLNSKDYRLVFIENYKVSDSISLKDITLMFYKNRLFLIYSDILYNKHINNLIDPIDLDSYDVKTETDTYGWKNREKLERNPIGTFFFDPKIKDCFYEDILDMKKYLKQEKDNNKKTNSKDLFGE